MSMVIVYIYLPEKVERGDYIMSHRPHMLYEYSLKGGNHILAGTRKCELILLYVPIFFFLQNCVTYLDEG